MQVKFKKGLGERFVTKAKKDFPAEHLVALLGKQTGEESYVVEAILEPNEDEITVDPAGNWIDVEDKFIKRAEKVAADLGLLLLGDLHSHCYITEERSDPVPSFIDFERFRHGPLKKFLIFGICELRKYKSGKVYKTFSFWEAKPPVKSNI